MIRRIVLLHGFLGDHRDWAPVLPALKERYACETPDLPGHGAHPPPADEAGLAEWFADLGRKVTPDTALIGYSMGGRLALHAALFAGVKPAALVLEGASAGIAGDGPRAERLAADRERADRLRRLGLHRFLEEWYAQPLFDSLRRRPALLARLSAERGGDARALADALSLLSPGRMPCLLEALPRLDLPVLALAGEEDTRYAAAATEMAARHPRIRAKVVGGAGHNLHRENPGGWLRAVKPFLENAP